MRHFTFNDRMVLYGLILGGNLTLEEIAKKLLFHEKTIKNEIKRGTVNGKYVPKVAQETIDKGRIANARARTKLLQNNGYKEELDKLLKPGENTPDTVAGRKKNIEGKTFVCTKTIYNYIRLYDGGLKKKLTYKKRYKKHNSRQGKKPVGYRHISERCEEANDRLEVGHMEIDLVLSKGNKAGLMTLTDRKSRFGLSTHTKSKHARSINNALKSMIKKEGIQKKLKTITSDNGKEFFGLKHVEKKLGFEQYFADPYSSRQRGTNEQYNWQIRKFFPKGTDFNLIPPKIIRKIQTKLNRKPRKCLGYLTPEEVFYGTTI